MWGCCLVSLISLILPFGSQALYSSSSSVISLTSSNFDRHVKNSEGIWIVEFFAPWCGHCQQLVPEYQKAASALKGLVSVGAVDCDAEKSLCASHSVSGFPSIKIFSPDKSSPESYSGQRTASALVSAAQSAAQRLVAHRLGGSSSGGRDGKSGKKSKDGEVVTLTDSNFRKLVLESNDMWLVEFFAPWCGHCKNLEPHWKKAAEELKGKVKLGAVDATIYSSLAQQYGVQGYPTIKYFPQGAKTSPEEYDGGRTASDIVAWANERHEVQLPPPEVFQAVSEQVIKDNCHDKPLCVIAFLPHILDCQSDCRNNYIKMLLEIGDKFKKQGWGWLWSEGMAQPDLESALDVGGFGYPAMSVVSVKKGKYSSFTGSFSKDGINEFLRDLSYGKGRTNTIRGATLPQLATIDKWDGKDGEMPVEEEIDLSDVELVDLPKDEL